MRRSSRSGYVRMPSFRISSARFSSLKAEASAARAATTCGPHLRLRAPELLEVREPRVEPGLVGLDARNTLLRGHRIVAADDLVVVALSARSVSLRRSATMPRKYSDS